jgi:hypothetical protein
MYVFKFAAFVSVKRCPFEATSTTFINGMDCSLLFTTVDSNKFGIRVGCDLYILSKNGWWTF